MPLWARSLPRLWRRLGRAARAVVAALAARGLRLRAPSLPRSLRRLGHGRRAVVAALAARGLRLRAPSLPRSLRRLGRGRPAAAVALAARGLRLRARSLPGLWRRLGPVPQAVCVALAVAALALAAGLSHQDPKPPSRPGVPTQAAGPDAVLSATAAQERVAERHGRRRRRGGPEYYRRTARKHVSAKGARAFLPLYREAARRYVVNWRLIASIHRQETAFSTAPSTYQGLNDFGCCAGPMQFNVTNGPVSTWERYRNAFRDGRRPKRYPHRTRKHPSVYDDFDAIMAAGSLLSDSGAGPSLDGGAWSAGYSYYGHDLYGVTYASQVLARAVAWERDGFCPNCELDDGLVAEFDDAYGASVREELIAAERRRKKHKKEKRRRDQKSDRGDRQGRRKGGDSDDRARRRSPAGGKRRPTPPSRPRPRRRTTGPTKPSPPPPTPTQPSTPPPTTAPAPPPGGCSPVRKLLGC